MAKYDWAKLKREYLLGDYKSLREFATVSGIPYNGHFAKATTGWAEEKRAKQEQKESKIMEAVTEQEIKYELDRNAAHMAAGDLIMAKLNVAIGGIKPKDQYAINKLKAASETLGNVQKIQRLGDGDSFESAVNVIDDL